MNKLASKYSLNQTECSKLISRVKNILKEEQNIIFAYLHGSFVSEKTFSDLDIALYLKDMGKAELLNQELKLEELLESNLKLPVDLKVLNMVSPVFSYLVVKKMNSTDFARRSKKGSI